MCRLKLTPSCLETRYRLATLGQTSRWVRRPLPQWQVPNEAGSGLIRCTLLAKMPTRPGSLLRSSCCRNLLTWATCGLPLTPKLTVLVLRPPRRCKDLPSLLVPVITA